MVALCSIGRVDAHESVRRSAFFWPDCSLGVMAPMERRPVPGSDANL